MKNYLPKILPISSKITLIILCFWLLPPHSLWAGTNLNGHGTEADTEKHLLSNVSSRFDDSYGINTNKAIIEISGKVVDENGQPIPGATVIVEGTNQGTVSDIDGNFTIDADQGAVILISFIGYQPQRVTVENQTQVSVILREDQSSLEEVVVVGYGTQRKSDLTGAISSVTSKDLQETPAGNFLEQSQGRLAGVDIVRANGSPGSPVQIRVRGNRSINASNEPLYVIDGIPTTANINDFNPNDIESMEVLKDASAVAIYGSRGANGVVLILSLIHI